MFPNELLSLYPKGDRVLYLVTIRMGIPPQQYNGNHNTMRMKHKCLVVFRAYIQHKSSS